MPAGIDFEEVYAALYARLLNNVSGVLTYSRALRHWDSVSQNECPYLGLDQHNPVAEYVQKQPIRWRLSASIWLYGYTPDTFGTPVAILMNNLLTAVQNRLLPDPGPNPVQKLGLSRVQDCYIDGEIITDEGTLGQLGVFVVPVKIFVC